MTKQEHDKLLELCSTDKWQALSNVIKYLETLEITEELDAVKEQKTPQQNRGLWLFFQKLADALIEKGVTMRAIFEKTEHFDIPPTKDSVHDLWCYFQKRMYGTDKTRDLKKIEQIDRVHEVVMKNVRELFHVEYISFPSEENKMQSTRENPDFAEYYKNEDVEVRGLD